MESQRFVIEKCFFLQLKEYLIPQIFVETLENNIWGYVGWKKTKMCWLGTHLCLIDIQIKKHYFNILDMKKD